MATREARTTVDPIDADMDAAPEALEGEVEQAPDNAVTLADGRVALLAENSAFAARRARKALLRMGVTPAVDPMDYTICMSLYSIETLDGERFKKPTTEITLNAILMNMTEKDTYALALAYGRLVGQGDPTDADFRERL